MPRLAMTQQVPGNLAPQPAYPGQPAPWRLWRMGVQHLRLWPSQLMAAKEELRQRADHHLMPTTRQWSRRAIAQNDAKVGLEFSAMVFGFGVAPNAIHR